MNNPVVLELRNLRVTYPGANGRVTVVNDVNLAIREGEAVGLIGESGSGKSTIALTVLGYLASGGKVESGDVLYRGESLLDLSAQERRKIYGRFISLVPQEPMNSLNPVLTIGTQITETLRTHLSLSGEASKKRALELLEMVHLPGGEELLNRYPHQLSGGMQQRVFIAMALACDPELLVLDEPTTGLDATTETTILELIEELKAKINASILFISHDLGVVARIADRVAIMYRGRIVESGPSEAIFRSSAHRYTQMLLESVPRMRRRVRKLVVIPWQSSETPYRGCPFIDRCDMAVDACKEATPMVKVGPGHQSACVRWDDVSSSEPVTEEVRSALDVTARDRSPSDGRPDAQDEASLLVIEGLTKEYKIARPGRLGFRHTIPFRAVDDVHFELKKGETFALVGESGSGKSTLARSVAGLLKPTDGNIRYSGMNLSELTPKYPLRVRREMQMVFQNVQASVHPRKTIKAILSRPFELYESRRPSLAELTELLHYVNLDADVLGKKPPELSGGQKQRVGLLRAFAPQPKIIILDEALSALDVSLKATVMRLLSSLKEKFGTAYLFISHDLPVVRYMADSVAVMCLGWVCESGPNERVFSPPYHPYTEALLSSVKDPEPQKSAGRERIRLHGLPPSPGQMPTGCRFHTRCPRKLGSICENVSPAVQQTEDGHRIACHIPLEELREMQKPLAGEPREEAVS